MHPNARQFRVRPCIACGYPFSDAHHIHPEILGRHNSPQVILCPNHHRFAHIVQGMVITGTPSELVQDFAQEHFDCAFNEQALRLLLSTYGQLQAVRRIIITQIKIGDYVIIHPRPYSLEWKDPFDNCWAQVESITELVRVIVAGNTLAEFYPDELEVITNPDADFKRVAEKVNRLLRRDDLDELEREILNLYCKRTAFTKKNLNILATISIHYEGAD